MNGNALPTTGRDGGTTCSETEAMTGDLHQDHIMSEKGSYLMREKTHHQEDMEFTQDIQKRLPLGTTALVSSHRDIPMIKTDISIATTVERALATTNQKMTTSGAVLALDTIDHMFVTMLSRVRTR